MAGTAGRSRKAWNLKQAQLVRGQCVGQPLLPVLSEKGSIQTAALELRIQHAHVHRGTRSQSHAHLSHPISKL